MRTSTREKTGFIIKFIILVIFAITCIYPLIWLVLNSFKTNDQLFENPWGLPKSFDIKNYIVAITEGNIGTYFINSVIIAVSAVLVTVVLSSMASYAISRMEWKYSKVMLNVFLLGMMIPVYATIIPLFSIFNRIGILNTHLSVIIPHIAFGFPMAIFILTGFFQTIPRDIEEAAVMDGCSIFRIFFRIIMPISKPSVVTVAVVVFIGVWNDLLMPQIFLTDATKMTLPVGLNSFKGMYSTDYVSMIAAVVLTVIPSVIIYIVLHKNIMEGMVAGAVKG
ncbi:raffinose/stachyose/melibiose transport system permease protein [Aequitasia blattaphilus]|uniref:Carbohydrate ABC transporter permease n=1 Tax=Aequitasia blattaphilus TaxID=2949332 RepID=A0ABT1EAZ7_9FIRM|nr:carbohydrate ABC transporter permease [Aequitasia blattaphilus]MCP1102987.1 carbohydrate ABC transporter permease [Aequitasia blattaphilus]MCR8615627.1 carbohydrate ABC transporter permease [Aequitasia blattaphilus]